MFAAIKGGNRRTTGSLSGLGELHLGLLPPGRQIHHRSSTGNNLGRPVGPTASAEMILDRKEFDGDAFPGSFRARARYSDETAIAFRGFFPMLCFSFAPRSGHG